MTVELSRDMVFISDNATGVVVVDTDKQHPNILYEATQLNLINTNDMVASGAATLHVNSSPFIYTAAHVSSHISNLFLPSELIGPKTKPMVFVRVSSVGSGSNMGAIKNLGWMHVPGFLPLELYYPEPNALPFYEPFCGMCFVEVDHTTDTHIVQGQSVNPISIRVNRYFALGYAGESNVNTSIQGYPMTNYSQDASSNISFTASNSAFSLDVHLKLFIEE